MSEQEISGKWKKRFDLIDKAGGVKLPLVKNLSFSERVTAAFNIWGFIFGVLYYGYLGMWKKGLFLFGIITLVCVLTALLESVFPEIKLLQKLNALTYIIMPVVCGAMVNIDYYKKIFVKEKSDENKSAYIGIASIIAAIAIVSFIYFKESDPLDDLSGVWKGDTDQATVVISLKSDNKSIEINGKVIPVKVMEWDSRSDILSLIVNNNTSVVWALRKISSKDGSFTLKLTTNDGHEDTLSFVRNINKVVQAPPTEAKRTDTPANASNALPKEYVGFWMSNKNGQNQCEAYSKAYIGFPSDEGLNVDQTGLATLEYSCAFQKVEKLSVSNAVAGSSAYVITGKCGHVEKIDETFVLRIENNTLRNDGIDRVLSRCNYSLDDLEKRLVERQKQSVLPPPTVAAAPTATAQAVAVDTSLFSPSFDCAKASNGPERLICSDRDLAKLDVQLGQTYSKAVGKAADKKKLQVDQLDWMKGERNACSDKPCMAAAIEKRIKVLSN